MACWRCDNVGRAANHRIPLSRAPRSLYTLPTLIEAGAISAQPFQTRRPLERNYATRASGRPYAHELRGSRLKPRLPNLRERKPFSPLHSPHRFDSIFHRNRAEETMAPFANSSTRRFEFRLNRRSLLPTPLPTRLSRSVTDVLEPTTVHVLRRPVISRSLLLVARSAIVIRHWRDPCVKRFSLTLFFPFFSFIRGFRHIRSQRKLRGKLYSSKLIGSARIVVISKQDAILNNHRDPISRPRLPISAHFPRILPRLVSISHRGRSVVCERIVARRFSSRPAVHRSNRIKPPEHGQSRPIMQIAVLPLNCIRRARH